MVGISACRTRRSAAVHDFLVIPQEYGALRAVVGKDLRGLRDHAVAAFCRGRRGGHADGASAGAACTLGAAERGAADGRPCFARENVAPYYFYLRKQTGVSQRLTPQTAKNPFNGLISLCINPLAQVGLSVPVHPNLQ